MKIIAYVDSSSYSLPYDYYYIKELIRNGYLVEFYCSRTNKNSGYINELIENGVKVHLYSVSGGNRFIGVASYVAMLVKLAINFRRYKRIHFSWMILSVIELPFFLLIRKKLILTLHNHVPHESKKKRYLPFLIAYILARRVVFPSKYTKSEFLKIYDNINIEKAYVIKHGVLPFDLRDKITKRKRIDKEISRLIFWGNVRDYKGLDSFRKLVGDKQLSKYSFEIYGTWHKNLLPLKSELSSLGVLIEDRYLSHKEILDLMQENTLFLLPYKKATQSGVLYTLLYYQQAFISSNYGDNRDFLINASLNSLIADFLDPASVVRAIDYVNENKRKVYDILLRQREKFQWKRVMSNVGEIYE